MTNSPLRIHLGQISFVDDIDFGSEHSVRFGDRTDFGPWYCVACDNLSLEPDDPTDARLKFERVKQTMDEQISALKLKKPDLKVPKVEWKFGLRDGEWQRFP